MPKDAPADMKKQAEEMGGKMADMMVKHCKDDKWSADVIKCGNTAKDPKTECMGKLTAEQQQKIQDDMMGMMGGGMGMAMPKDEPTADTGSGSGTATTGSGSAAASGSDTGSGAASGSGEASGSGSGEASGSGAASGSDTAAAGGDTAGAKTGLANCDALVDYIASLKNCSKLDDATRKSIEDSVESMKQGWTGMDQAPEESKKAADDGCKTSLDGMKQGMAAYGC